MGTVSVQLAPRNVARGRLALTHAVTRQECNSFRTMPDRTNHAYVAPQAIWPYAIFEFGTQCDTNLNIR